MALRRAKGNMYDWISHTHTHLGGECPHSCTYCYVNLPIYGRPEKYRGPIRLIEKELEVPYRKGKTIFIENCNDLFAAPVSSADTLAILAHCCLWPENTYVFQTKEPSGYSAFQHHFPPQTILGVTIETNRGTFKFSKAPDPHMRFVAMLGDFVQQSRRFVTIEPIMDFDLDILSGWIKEIRPEFVNIGADSKGHHLPEPPIEKVQTLISLLADAGIEIREKHNLERLKK